MTIMIVDKGFAYFRGARARSFFKLNPTKIPNPTNKATPMRMGKLRNNSSLINASN